MSNATMPAMPSDVPVSHATLLQIAPIFLGSLTSFWLFGVSTMQLYVYYIGFPNDSKLIKGTVYSIFLLDIFQSLCVGGMGFIIFCSGWGQQQILLELTWPFFGIPIVSGIVSAWVQIFYAWRIYMFGKRIYLPIFVILVALAQCAAAIGITITIPSDADVQDLHKQFRMTIVWLGGATLADVIIAASMLYILFTVKRNNFQGTQRIINRLIRLTVETGVATAMCAFLELVMFLRFDTNNLHFFFATILCKVYSNSLMTSLNSRAMHSKPDTSLELSTGKQYSSFNAPLRQTGASTTITGTPTVVHVSTTTDAFEVSKQSFDMPKRNDLNPDIEMDAMTPSYGSV